MTERRHPWYVYWANPVRYTFAALLLLVAIVLLARAGAGMIGTFAAQVAPIILGTAWMLARQHRERRELVERGYKPWDAKHRVRQNATASLALIFTGAAVWAIVLPSIQGLVGLGAGVGGGAMGMPFMLGAAYLGWYAVARGRLVGHGPHCRHCAYPVADSSWCQCPECGRILASPDTVTDGRRERPPWFAALAATTTLMAVAIVVFGLSGRPTSLALSLAPTSIVLRIATGADGSSAQRAWDEIENRTLSAAQSAALFDGCIRRLDRPEWAYYSADTEIWRFMAEEALAGRLSPAQLDEMVAAIVRLPRSGDVTAAAARLMTVDLTQSQTQKFAEFVIADVEEGGWWVFGRAAEGQLTTAQEQHCVEVVRQLAVDHLNPMVVRHIEQVIVNSKNVALRDQMLDALIEGAPIAFHGREFADARVAVLEEAILAGHLDQEQAIGLLRQPFGATHMFGWSTLLDLEGVRRETVVTLLLTLLEQDGLNFPRDHVAHWQWLQYEAAAGRLSPEQNEVFKRAATILDPSP